MPCRFASSGTVATSRSASRAILALNVASNFLRDLVISVLHRLRQSRTLHTLTFGPISGVHFRTQTASGERFDTHELTAAHPTLPFGTQLRVTNVTTGRSVTVRVNDRGPFVPGRVVDVSYAAAETLGIVGGGVAKVKLDVVQ